MLFILYLTYQKFFQMIILMGIALFCMYTLYEMVHAVESGVPLEDFDKEFQYGYF